MSDSTLSSTLLLAAMALSCGDVRGALHLAEEVLRTDPAHAGAMNMVALVAHARGDLSRAGEILAAILRRDSRHRPTLMHLGLLHLDSGQPGKASDLFLRLLLLAPSDPGAAFGLARALEGMDKEEEAEGLYLHIQRLHPRLDRAVCRLALLYSSRGDLGRAAAAVHRGLRALPRSSRLYDALGRLLMLQARWWEAALAFERASRLKPRDPLLHLRRAEALERRGHLEKALSAVDTARSLGAPLRLMRARILTGLGRLREARGEYRKLLRLGPSSFEVRFGLASLLFRMKSYDSALEQFDLALSHAPVDARALNNKGACLYRLGRRAEAEECLRSLTRIHPEYPLGHYNLACLLEVTGKRPAARASLDRALSLDGGLERQAARDQELSRLIAASETSVPAGTEVEEGTSQAPS